MSEARKTITLSDRASKAVVEMSDKMGGVSDEKVARRGFILLDLLLNLKEDECLAVFDKTTGRIETLRYAWDKF